MNRGKEYDERLLRSTLANFPEQLLLTDIPAYDQRTVFSSYS